nr:transposase [Rhodococcus opacus]
MVPRYGVGRKFWTRLAELERLWADLNLPDPAELTVVVEPTRNGWIVLAEWFRRHGARVVMVPTTQSADLRTYYSKHTKNDRIDSELLARLPLLHPKACRNTPFRGPPTRCDDWSSSAPRWSSAGSRSMPGSMRSPQILERAQEGVRARARIVARVSGRRGVRLAGPSW